MKSFKTINQLSYVITLSYTHFGKFLWETYQEIIPSLYLHAWKIICANQMKGVFSVSFHTTWPTWNNRKALQPMQSAILFFSILIYQAQCRESNFEGEKSKR